MIAVTELIESIKPEVIQVFGNPEGRFIKHLQPVESVDEDTLDWITRLKTNKQFVAEQSRAKVILCDETVAYTEGIVAQDKVLIQVYNPKLALALIADAYFEKKPQQGIHPTASVHPEAEIPSTVSIGANCAIGRCVIGEWTSILPNVTIYDGVSIGRRSVIQAGAVIGTDGLGCERRDDGTLVKFPHLGGVEIGDDVEIGANGMIARGSLSNTIIGNGCKINGNCVIAHNCILGKNVWISVSTTIAGSTKIGENATIFSQVVIREQRTIGNGATIGMGSVVTKDIPAGETWFGSPARKIEK
jgi:UDP-3-O-[3-hydroxymyristoyl] glucosamine N-acyltransferase